MQGNASNFFRYFFHALVKKMLLTILQNPEFKVHIYAHDILDHGYR